MFFSELIIATALAVAIDNDDDTDDDSILLPIYVYHAKILTDPVYAALMSVECIACIKQRFHHHFLPEPFWSLEASIKFRFGMTAQNRHLAFDKVSSGTNQKATATHLPVGMVESFLASFLDESEARVQSATN